ncbi:MAG TPA: response regulator [Gemmatimonadaceae bacterium]|nr:response regulator [Gemmatimonadaceae bacterium]
MATTILVIDDEPQIRRVVRNALADDGVQVSEAGTATKGIDLAAAERPGLIVLDLGLPDGEGAEVLREIRKWSSAPVLVLSARGSDQEKVRLLDAGADDYVTKPFSTVELKARVRALLRRTNPAGEHAEGPIEVGGLTMDLAKPSLHRGAEVVHLTRTEWDLLRVLVRHAGRTLTHRQLFDAVWGKAFGDPQQNLRVHIRSLRRKIEADPVRPRLIVTEPGVGYRFDVTP